MLPADEIAYLERLGLDYTLESEAGMVCLILHDYPLPSGYDRAKADLLLRLPPGFPDIAPDMWWMDPPILYVGGGVPQATEAREVHRGRTWQRWSRHFIDTPWRPGRDSLQSYLRLIRTDLANGVLARAA